MSDPTGGGFDSPFEHGFDLSKVPLFRELAKVLAWRGGPVNWDLARQTAEAVVAEPSGEAAGRPAIGFTASAPSVTAAEAAALADAVRVAELWLDEVTALPAVDGPVLALSRTEWIRRAATPEGLGAYMEPLAAGVASALSSSLPEELTALAGPVGGMGAMGAAFGSFGAFLFGTQAGTVAGHLAQQLLTAADLGLPTMDPRTIATVGDAAARFGADHGLDAVELRHWLALREAALRRLWAGVPWLHAHVGGLIADFAAQAEHDPAALFEQFGSLGLGDLGTGSPPGSGSPLDPAAMAEALGGPGGFELQPSAAQQATLARLQAVVALVQAWCDTVVGSAARPRLPSVGTIDEAMRRRRAQQGPGERFLAQLVGLDLRPADVRAGQAFCDAVVAARGQAGLDRAWQAEAHLPSPAELADPSRWLIRMAAIEIEAGIEVDLGEWDPDPST